VRRKPGGAVRLLSKANGASCKDPTAGLSRDFAFSVETAPASVLGDPGAGCNGSAGGAVIAGSNAIAVEARLIVDLLIDIAIEENILESPNPWLCRVLPRVNTASHWMRQPCDVSIRGSIVETGGQTNQQLSEAHTKPATSTTIVQFETELMASAGKIILF
jgi:hypothetical protein